MDKIIVPGTTGSAAGPTTTTTAATTISLKRGRRQRGSHGQRPAAESRHRGGLRQREVVVGLLPGVLLLPALRPPLRGLPPHGARRNSRLMMVLISKSIYKFLT